MRIFLMLLLTLVQFNVKSQTNKHVVLITVDGLRPEFYLSDNWKAPNFKQLVKKGAFAEGMTSVFPSMTFPAHTTMITGVTPDEHGVHYNSVFEPDSVTGAVYWNYSQIKSPTIWGAAKKKGLKVASFVWPVSAEAPVDFNVPDIAGMGNAVLEKYSQPVGITATLKKEAYNNAEKIDISNDVGVSKMAAWTFKNHQPNLMTVHMFNLDHKEHEFGRNAPQVQDAVTLVDSCVGIIWKAVKEAGLEENTLFIVIGDHGFYDAKRSLNPNVLLAKAGLLRNSNGDWDARFHTVGGAAFLFVKDNDPKITVEVRKIFEELPVGERQFYRIIDATNIKKVGGDPNAVLALSALNSTAFGSASKGEFITDKEGGTHGHYPDSKSIQTGFMAFGKDVNANQNLKEMHLLDIVPIICKYLGIEMGIPLKGKVPQALFKE